MGTPPNLSAVLTARELAFITRYYGGRKSAAVHAGLSALMQAQAGLTVAEVAGWLAQAHAAEAQLLALAAEGGPLWDVVLQIHAIVDVWGAAHQEVSRRHWAEVEDYDGPDAGDSPAALAYGAGELVEVETSEEADLPRARADDWPQYREVDAEPISEDEPSQP